jgi:hypothetical protein
LAYALSASRVFGTIHTALPVDEPYAGYLIDTIASSGEAPGHVQLAYFRRLARAMVADGVPAGLSADAADSLFGQSSVVPMQVALLLRRILPLRPLRRGAAAVAGMLGRRHLRGCFDLADNLYNEERLDHPVNNSALWADWGAVRACFGEDAVVEAAARRRALLDEQGVPPRPLDRLHAAGFLGTAMNSASLTTTLFNQAGALLYCPFLDSRLLRLVVSLSPRQRFRFLQPKSLLKRSLARHGQAELAYRGKLSFGQPVFEWLGAGGQLRPLVEQIDDYDFLDPQTVEAARSRPGWFLYSLLCYDLWHKLFVSRTLPRTAAASPGRRPALTPAPGACYSPRSPARPSIGGPRK